MKFLLLTFLLSHGEADSTSPTSVAPSPKAVVWMDIFSEGHVSMSSMSASCWDRTLERNPSSYEARPDTFSIESIESLRNVSSIHPQKTIKHASYSHATLNRSTKVPLDPLTRLNATEGCFCYGWIPPPSSALTWKSTATQTARVFVANGSDKSEIGTGPTSCIKPARHQWHQWISHRKARFHLETA